MAPAILTLDAALEEISSHPRAVLERSLTTRLEGLFERRETVDRRVNYFGSGEEVAAMLSRQEVYVGLEFDLLSMRTYVVFKQVRSLGDVMCITKQDGPGGCSYSIVFDVISALPFSYRTRMNYSFVVTAIVGV